jgi:hypothetical protein
LKSLLKQLQAEGDKHEKNSKLPSLRQNLISRPLGKTENHKQQLRQMPRMRKHKSLERWKTTCFIWSNSEILLQRLWPQVFISLVSNFFPFSLWQLGGFIVEAEGNRG